MAHLTINPDSANAWVVILKEGENTVGRAEDNQVRLEEGGVSSHHCKIILNQGTVTVVDLNSTNGTIINGTRITQAVWNPGQTIHFGQLPVRLEGAQPAQAIAAPAVGIAAAPASAPPIPVPMPVAAAAPAKGQIKLRISGGSSHAAPAPAAPPVEETATETPPPVHAAALKAAPPGTRCKSHHKSLAKWYCGKCRKFFCDLCISIRATHTSKHHLCRACGSECEQVEMQAEANNEQGFVSSLPGAFLYPVKGMGVIVLIIVTIIFTGSSMPRGLFAWIIQMMATGYLFVFLQSIIHCSAAGDEDMPSMPEFDGLFSAFFTLIGTIAVCFCLPIALLIAKVFGDVDIPPSFIVASIFLCLLYFPMAFLSVAMNDSVMGVNPMVVIPAILKVPLHYAVTVVILCFVYGIRYLGDKFTAEASGDALSTRDMSVMFMSFGLKIVWALLSIYLLTVAIRILGILYVKNKEKLGWF